MQVRSSLLVVFAALGTQAVLTASGTSAAPASESAQTPTIQKVDLGDYEVVYPWPTLYHRYALSVESVGCHRRATTR